MRGKSAAWNSLGGSRQENAFIFKNFVEMQRS